MKRWLCISLAIFAGMSANAGVLTGRIEQRYQAAPEPMFLPTSVSVSSNGTVAVADGVNQRVVLFTADGQQLRVIDAETVPQLDSPLSVRFINADQLLLVDNAQRQLFVVDTAGQLLNTIPLTGDITDVVPATDGYWAVVNDSHQITRFNNSGQTVQTIGEVGAALGQFNYPYRATAFSDGRIGVTDTINGRVEVIGTDGTVTRAIGRYGVQPGELYRPKGIAIDSQDRVWVSDGVLGVVQCFSAQGEFVGVLRDENDEILRFAAPHGLAFDTQDRLYVVELMTHHVVRVAIEISSTAPKPEQPPQRLTDQPRHCTACHIEWMAPLVNGQATELAEVPDNPPNSPHVSHSTVCLSCHDGSIADNRREVWRQHSHQTGITVPEQMNISEKLPLVDGKMVCRTCHSAHTRGGSGNVLKDAVFLRTEGPVTTLCTQCHAYNDAAAHPGHPLGSMPIAMPAALAHEGAFDSAPATMTCITCHMAHGGSNDQLLALPTNDNQLCLACHSEIAPNMFAAEHISKHGQLPQLTQQQAAVASGFHTRLGDDQKLLCVTCHQTHDAPRKYQLAFETNSVTCSGCHPAQRTVSQSPHDLSGSDADLVNRFGSRVSEHGACAACHGAHGSAFSPVPTAADQTGHCTNCHSNGGVVSAPTLPEHNHPDTACTACHNPHDNAQAHFLKAPPEQMCLSCHEDHTLADNSKHRLVSNSTAWPSESVATNDACLACHRPHGTAQTRLWRVPAKSYDDPTSVCIACHTAVSPDADEALQHPAIPEGHEHFAANTCTACHDPHRGVGESLLAASSTENSAETCYRCHSSKANIEHIGHGQIFLEAAGLKATACQPCHITHGASKDVAYPMQPASWLTSAKEKDIPVSNHECYACHTRGGDIPLPPVVTHPDQVMLNLTPPDDPAFLPLFNAEGQVDRNGQIGCKTCHLTHGRATPLPLPTAGVSLGLREARARAWHLREFRMGNVCTTCHGEDALRRFMYFHNEAFRSGSIETGR